MADVGAWSAAATATLAAIGSVSAVVRQPADVTTLRAEVKAAKDDAPEKINVVVHRRPPVQPNCVRKLLLDIFDPLRP
mgnify:CR=1 FL=1